MFLSKKIQSVNQFVLSNGKPPKIKPVPHNKPVIKMLVITPNEVLLRGLKVTLEKSNVVNIFRDNRAVVNALNYWEQQEKEAFPDLVVLDTQQRKMTCCEAILWFKRLNDKMKILVMGDYFRNENIKEFFDVGADGYIDIVAGGESIAYAAYRIVHEGKLFLYTPTLPMNGYIVLEPFDEGVQEKHA